ncbi:guanine nucleotide-binding protein G(I)/G(S)/G(O) subunit gamma-10-like [Perognathus longimembris pacificus]|uniref:guanine nucleotide-binding protein G(I)/G(S)/G(O) subunit gamma-10-like n=1 Tax=Perognathus longimembris pacificus TaxID=214514 RepID=UPI00201918E9|nr:guanine nucleotide-binding protein G(I)/G(S)/G(O) subunit gamma-10-like [Perognathus longimembris pacificus]
MSPGASVSALQRLVEQVQASQAAAELQRCCLQKACQEALRVGVPEGGNPFREPGSCASFYIEKKFAEECLQVSRKHFSLAK